jgi:FkbM family methyltransferase
MDFTEQDSNRRDAFGGHLQGSTYSDPLTIKNLALSGQELQLLDRIPNTGHARARPLAVIHAFEGATRTFVQLEKNVRRNQLSNVRLNNIAVADRNGTVEFQTPFNASVFGPIASPHDPKSRYQSAPKEIVNCERLDSYCRTHGIDCIDFLKIDVEGAEYRVLCGLAPLLERSEVRMCSQRSSSTVSTSVRRPTFPATRRPAAISWRNRVRPMRTASAASRTFIASCMAASFDAMQEHARRAARDRLPSRLTH